MPITSVEKDLGTRSNTVIVDVAATREPRWESFADPRQIERFWARPSGRSRSRVTACSLAGDLRAS